jgi:CPA1 family monovalent cation:H+ antiporter
MGMQARVIVARMSPERFKDAAVIVALVIVAITATRFVVVMSWNQIAQHWDWARGDLPAPTPAQGLLVSWSGVRGLLTMATAFALPRDFPQRDVVVLTAFGVVLATLVIQGLTLKPVIRLLGLHRMENPGRELSDARRRLAEAGAGALDAAAGREADLLRHAYALERGAGSGWNRYRKLGLLAVGAERTTLDAMREAHEIGQDSFLALQEAIDWRELTLLPDTDRQIEEN